METAGRSRLTAVHQAEDLFQEMANASPVMICCAGPDQLATFFNESWLKFRGRTMEQELGYGWTEGLHSDDRERVLAEIASSFKARSHCYVEYRLRRADGQYRNVLCSGVPRFSADTGFEGYIASCIDTTDAKRADEQAIAHQRLKSLGILTQAIAHDFNNLFGGILASAEVALSDHAEGLTVGAEVEKIRTAAIRGAGIVRELAIYGEAENTRFQNVDLENLIREMLPLLGLSASGQTRLRFDCAKNLPAMNGNPGHLRQVILNLVTNASEAIADREGVIDIHLNSMQLPVPLEQQNVIAGLAPGEYLHLEISDTGCGMTPELLERIFEPFFTTKLTGRGLGLAVVRKIVDNHGAGIRVSSLSGCGTRVQVWFPATEHPDTGTPRPAEKPAARQATAGTILLVEDEDLLRLAVAKGLRKKGFCVLEASDGRTALDFIHSSPETIDVVLLDVVLRQGPSSPQVFAESRRARPGLEFIVMSAYSMESLTASFKTLPFERFIRKPFHLTDLLRTIDEVLKA